MSKQAIDMRSMARRLARGEEVAAVAEAHELSEVTLKILMSSDAFAALRHEEAAKLELPDA